ncbi:MAG: DUF4832 domain-containing protein, partial [Acetatifactor sp.]|nr:DUF4832 domain-containing protein [Acetatifactor sp.]
LYDYIGAHMGYRFQVREVQMSPARGARRGMYRVELVIENCGFGNLCQEAELYLEWTDETGRLQRQRLECDLRELDGGCTQSIDCLVQGCECTLYLAARRKWDGAPIRFANVSDEAGRTILGSLCRQAL